MISRLSTSDDDGYKFSDVIDPTITFYRAIPSTIGPIRADKAALGVVPAAAFKYCEALRLASSFGWYVFAPMTFYVQWDGTDILWTHAGSEDGAWFPLQEEQFPGLPQHFASHAPEDVKAFAPPFLSRTFQQPGVIQVWSGLFAKTASNWSLLVRPPANMPRSQSYECYEGIIETDQWFGPLFINLRLTAIDRPIEISLERPLFQVQPLRRETYADQALRNWKIVEDLSQMTGADWEKYRQTIVRPNIDLNRRAGTYGSHVRKRAADDEK